MHPFDEDPKVADYFVVAGLGDASKPRDVQLNFPEMTPQINQPRKDPITDICVIDKTMEESCPQGFTCIEKTVSGFLADLNHGSFTAHNMFLCYRRGRDKPPLVDLGVYYEGLETIKSGITALKATPAGRSANVNNKSGMSSFPIYLTYRRADGSAPQSTLVVTDICIIMTNKNEEPPYAYCLINKNLNKGMIGSSVFLCYKKSMKQVHSVTFKPELLGRYPTEDTSSFPLPMSVPLFCLPMGAPIECWTSKTKHPLPTFSSFVLTTETSSKVYGAVISFYESYPESLLQEEHKYSLGLLRADGHRSQGKKTLHTIKAICMLSRWPLFDAFRDFLIFIYRLTVSPITHMVPIERYIAHFIHRVPFPSPERPRVQYQMSPMHATVLTRPQTTPIPLSGASFLSLLDDIGADNTLTMITLALMEHKMLIHSLRRSEITRVAEALITLLFPFKWQCTYVPLCPLEMAYVLEAPTPFIVGADSRYFDTCEPPSDVVCVNLDTNTITQFGEKKITWKMLPKKPAKHARNILNRLFNEIKRLNLCLKDEEGEYMTLNPEVTRTKRHLQIELTVQETILKFMSVMMNGYREFLLPLTEAPSAATTDPKSLFNMQDFVHKQDRSCQRFFSTFTSTQLFAAFIEARSFASLSGGYGGEGAGKAASLVFFDECIDRLKGEYVDTVRLIEADDTLSSERTIIVMPPDETGLPTDAGYRYTTFPLLQEELFVLNNEDLSNAMVDVDLGESTKKRRRSATFMIGRRTKQEMKVSQKQAKLCSNNAKMWARLLFSNVHSVWFGCLLDYSSQFHSKGSILRLGLDILYYLKDLGCIPLPDETSYRILMHLCCLYNNPVLAVRVFHFLRDSGTQLSAVTYGLYNKALLECTWPSSDRDGYVLWQKLKNVFIATIKFRQSIKRIDANSSISEGSDVRSDGDSSSQKSIDRSDVIPNAQHTRKTKNYFQAEALSPSHVTDVLLSDTTEVDSDQILSDTTDPMSRTEEHDVDDANRMMLENRPTNIAVHYANHGQGDNAVSCETIPITNGEEIDQKGAGDSSSQKLDSIAEEPNAPAQMSRSHSGSIVKPLGSPVTETGRSVAGGLPDGRVHQRAKMERNPSRKQIIERKDITNLAMDPLSPTLATRSTSYTTDTPIPASITSKGRPLSLNDPILFSDTSDEAPHMVQCSSLNDIPFAQELHPDGTDSQMSTPNESTKKHNHTGLLRRSFSFAPTSSLSSNFLNSGSKLNSLLKATTIGVASKAKKLATNLAKDINETVQSNLAYYTPEKLKGSLSSLSELAPDQSNDDDYLRKEDFSGSQTSLQSSSDKQSWRSGSGSLRANSGTSHSTLNTSRPTLAMSSSSLNAKTAIEMDITISSCSKCPRCECPVYDEEIMSGWMADESNLNTHCPFCNSLFVPLLNIRIKNYKNRVEIKTSMLSMGFTKSMLEGATTPNVLNHKTLGMEVPDNVGNFDEPEPIAVQYLSPLVLRKELESLLENEGMSILGEPEFVDLHPIVYWNFVWYFRRLNLQSSLYNLVLESKIVHCQQTSSAEPRPEVRKNAERVIIRTMWDNPKVHENMVKPALYLAYLRMLDDNAPSDDEHYSAEFLDLIKISIRENDLRTPLLAVLSEYTSHGGRTQARRGAYRDILFLIIAALGKDSIDIDAYDQAYDNVFDELSVADLDMTRKCDKPPNNHTRECRNIFGALDLV